MDFPVTPAAFLTVAGITIFGNLITQWLKRYLKDWQFTPLLTLGICMVTALIMRIVIPNGPSPASIMEALLKGFIGGTVSVFGYEVTQNIRGVLGKGPSWRRERRGGALPCDHLCDSDCYCDEGEEGVKGKVWGE